MIRLGVFSDSHGEIELFEKAVRGLNDISAIVHLGDCASDAMEIARRTGKNIISVDGNCDFFAHGPTARIYEAEGVRICITHGHKEHVKTGLMRLSYRAEEENATVALYGHTHIQRADDVGGQILLNPGAMKDGKYAVVMIKEGQITYEFFRTEI